MKPKIVQELRQKIAEEMKQKLVDEIKDKITEEMKQKLVEDVKHQMKQLVFESPWTNEKQAQSLHDMHERLAQDLSHIEQLSTLNLLYSTSLRLNTPVCDESNSRETNSHSIGESRRTKISREVPSDRNEEPEDSAHARVLKRKRRIEEYKRLRSSCKAIEQTNM